jgi:CubicO group peptidase (beta-lactamase class C family)
MQAMRLALCAAGVVAFLITNPAETQTRQGSDAPAFPSDAEIRSILAERVEAVAGNAGGMGIVVGVVGPQGRRIISYGRLSQGNPRALDGNTVFEIGSVAKTLTALLLADMVQRGEVAIADPVVKYLPDIRLPSRGGRSITLIDLATHTSALPFMPEQSSATWPAAATPYTASDLRDFLAGYELPYDIGTRWEYSNIGYWLLGEALASRASMDFNSLLRARVIAPLNLANTDFVLSPTMKDNLAVGHDAALQPAPALSTLPIYSLLTAAGVGLFSTANDLSTLLSVALGYERSPLGAALAVTVSTRRPMSQDGDEQALGWTVIGKGNDQLIFRDGGTLGCASCVVWDPTKRLGVAVLSNQVASVSDIGRHLLRPDFPLARPAAATHTEISLDAALLDTYVGRYEAPGEGVFSIFREGDHLMIESPAVWGLPPLRIRPEGPLEFFASELPLRVTFQTDSNGRVSGILVYPPRGQNAVPARRIGWRGSAK